MLIRRLLLNILAITLSLSLSGLLFEGLVFAQEGKDQKTNEEVKQQEDHDTKDLEQLLRRYNTDSEKLIDDTSKIHNTDETTTEVSEEDIEEIPQTEIVNAVAKKSSRKKKETEFPYKEQSFSENIRIPLAKFQTLSEGELLKLLKENTSQSKWGPYLDQFPRLSLFSVRLIKDKEAIPSAVKIIENKDKLIWFGGVMISTFLIGILLERIMRKENRSIMASIGLYLLRVLILTGIRFAVIIYFYGDELQPAGRVFKQTFL